MSEATGPIKVEQGRANNVVTRVELWKSMLGAVCGSIVGAAVGTPVGAAIGGAMGILIIGPTATALGAAVGAGVGLMLAHTFNADE